MPDFKFWEPEMARRYIRAPNYPEAARRAIKEMHRQVGTLVVDENGLALRGLILRHLVMPGEIAGTREVLEWTARELGPDTYVNVMPQYYPAGKVSDKEHAEINRCISLEEFQNALEAASEVGLRNLDNRSLVRAIMR
jgi:putative pyruvate formate lyase activating enzyme